MNNSLNAGILNYVLYFLIRILLESSSNLITVTKKKQISGRCGGWES